MNRIVAFAFVLVAALTVPVPVVTQVATVTWDGGGGDGRWSTAANWDGDTLPGPTSDVIIQGAGIVRVDTDVTVNSIVFGNGNRALASFGDDTLQVEIARTLTIRATHDRDSFLYEDVTIGGRLIIDPADTRITRIGPGTFINNGELRINNGFVDQEAGSFVPGSPHYGSAFLNQGHISIAGGALRLGRGIALNLGEIVLSNDALLSFSGEGNNLTTANGFTNAVSGRIRGTGRMFLGDLRPADSPRSQVPFINRGTVAVGRTANGASDHSILTATPIQNYGSIGPSDVSGAVAAIGVYCGGDIAPLGTITVPIEMACYTWVGRGVTGNWSDPLNWTMQEIPPNTTSLPILLQPAPVQPQLDVNFAANGHVTILDGTTLTVGPDLVLRLSAEVDNFGELVNFGQVTIAAPDGVLTNDGSIQNEGGMRNDGTILNNGVLNTSGSFLNTSAIENHAQSTLANSGILINEGVILNSGTVTSSAVLHSSGTFENRPHSTFANSGHLANTGSFIVNCGVEFVPGSTSGTLTLFCATWDGGGGDGRWSTAANWIGDTLPNATSDVVLRDAGIVHVDVDVTVNSIVFGSGNRLGDDTLLVDVGRTLTIRATRDVDSFLYEDVTIGGSLMIDPVGRGRIEFGLGTFINNGEFRIKRGFVIQLQGHAVGSTFLNQGLISMDGSLVLRFGAGVALNLGEIVLSDDALLEFDGPPGASTGPYGFTNGPPGRIRGDGHMLLRDSFHPSPSPLDPAPFINRGTIALSTTNPSADASIDNRMTIENHGSIGPGSSGVAGINNTGEVRNACGATIAVPVMGNPIVQASCNTPPTVSAGANQTIEAMAPLTPVVLAGVASDADGDPLTVQWHGSSGALLASTPAVNLQLPLGTHLFTFSADDGHGGTTSDTVQIIVRDTTVPEISVTRSPDANAHGWNNANVFVDFTCSDSVSGIGVAPVDVTVSAQGANRSATASCRDGAGNLATVTVTGINIDTMAPSITAARLPAANANGWNNTSVTTDFSCTDALSGVFEAPADRILVAEGSHQSASATCRDAADNIATLTLTGINIDTTAPSIAAVRLPAANANGWNNTSVTIDFSCTDGLSGVFGAPLDDVVEAEGSNQSASASCRDAADNVATRTESGINIDRTSPVVVGTPDRAPDSNGWYRNPFAVAWSGTDGLSGIAGCSGPSAYAGPDTAGHSLSGSCEDRAGNSAAAQHAFRFDATPPAIAIAAPADGGAYLLNQPAAAVYACPDQLSGVALCVGAVASGNTFDTSIPGLRTFTVQAIDMAGNTATRTHSYAVQYVFNGFLAPLSNLPTMNRGPAGRTFTLRWQLRDANGTLIADPASITGLALVPGVCNSAGTDVSDVEAIADGDDLRYDPTTGTWLFTMRTQRSQVGCWYLQLRLADGSVKPIGFELR